MSNTGLSKTWKLIALAEIIDNIIPDPPLVIRTAITKKSTADSINLNRTKTSQAARKIEEQLAQALEKEYKKIIADPSNAKDIGFLQRKYGPEVEQIIRAAVQKLYLIGSDYLTKSLDTTAFITTKDLDNIKKAVTRFSEAFWKRISNAVHKSEFTMIPKTAQVGDPTVEDPFGLSEDTPPESDPAADTAFLATLIATSILALSTLTKLDQIPSEQKRKLVWVTEQDTKVCLICQGLQGQEWEEGQAPIPGPDSSHYNCRCRLMLKMGEDILSG